MIINSFLCGGCSCNCGSYDCGDGDHDHCGGGGCNRVLFVSFHLVNNKLIVMSSWMLLIHSNVDSNCCY